MEKRLIDANALYDTITDVANSVGHDVMAVEDVHRCIDKAPTIYAVKVVRCSQCYYRDKPSCCPYQFSGFKVEPDWYCPMGVKKGAKMDAKDMDVPTKDGGAD